MIHNSIVRKLGLVMVAMFLSVLILLGVVLDYIFTNFYKGNMERNLDFLTNHYVTMNKTHGYLMLSMLDMIAEMSNVDIIIFNKDGERLAYSSNFIPPKILSLSQQDNDALVRGDSIKFEVSNEKNERFLATARPIIADDGYQGAIMLFASVEAVTKTIQSIRYLMILAGIGAVLVAVGMTHLMSRRLSDPLLQMEQAAQRMATGDFGVQVRVTTQDEIGSLAHAINELAGELRRYRDSRSEFFANISHELRTPITYLEGYTQVLKQKMYDTEEEKDKYLEVIHEEAGRMKHLVNDLFELAKMEEGKLAFTTEWMDLSEAMTNCLRSVEPRLKSKGLKLVTDMDSNLPHILGDGLRMEQIFLNLLENAIRYTRKGQIKVTMCKEQSAVVTEIADSGQGIPEAELPYIFERFYRVEKSRSREFGGTGLGLSIVKQLVELQEGGIQVKSNVEVGTTFIVTFPIKDRGGAA